MYGTNGFFNPECQQYPNQLDAVADIAGLISLVLAFQNLKENEYQSAHTEQLIKQIDLEAANQKQTIQLLEALNEKFEVQNKMLVQILKQLSFKHQGEPEYHDNIEDNQP